MAVLWIVTLVTAPRSDILTMIEIAAPPHAVWSVFPDPDDDPARNPMIAGLKGRLTKRAVIENIEGYGADRFQANGRAHRLGDLNRPDGRLRITSSASSH